MRARGKAFSDDIYGYIFFVTVFMIFSIVFAYISNSITQANIKTPTSVLKNDYPTIIIDAGHGGEDGGAIGQQDVFEKDINLRISFMIYDMLRVGGYDAVLTRNEDVLLYDRNADYAGRKKALDLSARVKIAESYENCIFISIHMNSFPDSRYSGLQVYYSRNNQASKKLADNIQNLVQENIQQNNTRQTKAAGSNIFVLDRITSPAVLVECGFLSNPSECSKLSDPKYCQELSLAISLAILKYIHSPT